MQAIMETLFDAVYPVSYTHLDVYKRQSLVYSIFALPVCLVYPV